METTTTLGDPERNGVFSTRLSSATSGDASASLRLPGSFSSGRWRIGRHGHDRRHGHPGEVLVLRRGRPLDPPSSEGSASCSVSLVKG